MINQDAKHENFYPLNYSDVIKRCCDKTRSGNNGPQET